MRQSKKQRIIALFESLPWIDDRTKIITKDHFRSIGLGGTVEYQETYCDVLYACQVIRKLGYRVYIGMCVNVFKK